MDADGTGGASYLGAVPAALPLEPATLPVLAQHVVAAVRCEDREAGTRGPERPDLDPVEAGDR